jgi:hypothetical protein
MAGEEQDRPRIGPFNVQVPPPSPNGSRVDHDSPVQMLRRATPGLVIGLVLSLSTVPSQSLFGTAHFTQWWHLALAAGLGGLAAGAGQHVAAVASGAGAGIGAAGLLLAYAIVAGKIGGPHGAGRVVADLARLTAWGIVAGGTAALAGFGVRRVVAARRGRESLHR